MKGEGRGRKEGGRKISKAKAKEETLLFSFIARITLEEKGKGKECGYGHLYYCYYYAYYLAVRL